MNIIVKIERKGQIKFTQVRQMEHDEKVGVGSKIAWGSGAKWTVLEVQ